MYSLFLFSTLLQSQMDFPFQTSSPAYACRCFANLSDPWVKDTWHYAEASIALDKWLICLTKYM